MVWFFVRSTDKLQLEIRNAVRGEGYEIVVRQGDDTEHLESCSDATALIERQQELANRWHTQGWSPLGCTWNFSDGASLSEAV